MRRATASVRHRAIARLVITLVAVFSLAAVVLGVLVTGPVNAAQSVTGLYEPVMENAKRVRELTTPFVIAVLPDTQGYTGSAGLGRPGFAKQIEWLLANAADKNIVFVTQVGDLVVGGTDDREWANARNALDPLFAQDWLPFSIVRGNHDDPGYFLKNLPLSLMQSKPWFVAASPSGLCQAQMFKVQEAWFLHIGFQVWATEAELRWADELLKRPSLRGLPVIVSTHDYLDYRGKKSSTGRRMWDAFVNDNPMVFMVLCGHMRGECLRQLQRRRSPRLRNDGRLSGSRLRRQRADAAHHHRPAERHDRGQDLLPLLPAQERGRT